MLVVFALTLLVFTQTTLASRNDDDWLDLRDLSHLLEAEKRYADKYAARMKERKKPIKDGYDEKCDQNPIDLGLIIDSSVSIDRDDYKTGLTFLANFLDEYEIGPGKNQVRVAAVSFGRDVYSQDGFNFSTYKTKEEVQNHIRTMPFRQGGRTDTGAALRHMREVQMQNTRSSATKLILVLTDGDSQDTRLTKWEATETKEDNITVFAVGVGRRIKYQELLNIAGLVKEHVFQANSYNSLDEDVKSQLTQKTCYLVPKPTTTTTTVPSTQAERRCGLEFPADINFVFSATSMGLDETASVTSVITNVIRHEELNEGFQYGVVSGDCPADEGFRLDQYQTFDTMQEHLQRYDSNNLHHIVDRATTTRFTLESGARENATKTAVIFLGKTKVNEKDLIRSIEQMVGAGIRVFVSGSNPKTMASLRKSLPDGVITLEGGAFSQATQLVNYLCPYSKKFEEGEVLPDYIFGDDEGFL